MVTLTHDHDTVSTLKCRLLGHLCKEQRTVLSEGGLTERVWVTTSDCTRCGKRDINLKKDDPLDSMPLEIQDEQ